MSRRDRGRRENGAHDCVAVYKKTGGKNWSTHTYIYIGKVKEKRKKCVLYVATI